MEKNNREKRYEATQQGKGTPGSDAPPPPGSLQNETFQTLNKNLAPYQWVREVAYTDPYREENKRKLADLEWEASKNARNPLQARGATIDQSDQGRARAQQQMHADALMSQAYGRGPSLADMQMKRNTDRGIAQQMALATSLGGNPAAAARVAADNQARIQQSAAADSAMLRIQEQQQGQQLLGQQLASMRGQDQALASDRASLEQQASFANLQAAQQQQQYYDALVAQYTAAGISLDQAQWQARIAQDQANTAERMGIYNADKGLAAAQNQSAMQLTGAGIQGLATLGSGLIGAFASDRSLKKNIRRAEDETQAFLDDLKPYSYEYKDEKHGKGPRLGIMAQDVEKSDMGREIVLRTAGGKMIDTNKAVSATLAGLAQVNQRLKELEERHYEAALVAAYR